MFKISLATLSLFSPQKRETEKALKTAAGSVATDFHPSVHSIPKNP